MKLIDYVVIKIPTQQLVAIYHSNTKLADITYGRDWLDWNWSVTVELARRRKVGSLPWDFRF